MLVLYPDPRLGRKAEPREVDDGLRAVGERLLEAAKAAQAFGLAAVHIGPVAPIAVISTAVDPSRRDYLLLYNPEIVSLGGGLESSTEGSVSLPGVEVELLRSRQAEIAYDDGAGVRQVLRLAGLPARIAQHEIDQVNGVFFLDRLSRLRRDMVLKKWKKRAAAG